MAVLLYPEVQRKAQEELDRVVERGRLPDFSDRDELPYMTALCKEVLRWFPIAPLGVPHRAVTEDEYKGMRIPEGSGVTANIWYVRDVTRISISLTGV